MQKFIVNIFDTDGQRFDQFLVAKDGGFDEVSFLKQYAKAFPRLVNRVSHVEHELIDHAA